METQDENSQDDRFKRVEERAGIGSVSCAGVTHEDVRYTITRFQGMTRAGLPVPGVHRLDGCIEFAGQQFPERLIGAELSLHLDDGSTMQLKLIDSDGRVVAHGHGPGKCRCC